MKFKALSSLLCTALLSACSGSDSSPNEPAAKFDYAINAEGKLVAVNSLNGETTTVMERVSDLFPAGKLNEDGSSQVAAFMAVQNGRLAFVTPEDKAPVPFTSLQGLSQSAFCRISIQNQGDTPGLIYSTEGPDQYCEDKADNPVYYVDISMDETTDPTALSSNVWATANWAQEIYAQGKLMGYLVMEGQGAQASLSYHDRSFTQATALQIPSNYDPDRENSSVKTFLNSERNIITLGEYAFDRSASELESEGLGAAILEGDSQVISDISAEYAYLSTRTGLYRHTPGDDSAELIPYLNVGGSNTVAQYQGGSVVAFDDPNNPLLKRFVQIDSSTEALVYRPLLDIDFDTTGTTNIGNELQLYSGESSVLVNVDLDYAATDDQAYALLINSDGQVTRFDDAKWLPYSNGDYYANVPLLLKQGESGPSLVLVDEAQPQSQRVYGTLPSNTVSVTVASFEVGGQVLLSTSSNSQRPTSPEQFFRFQVGRANSLESIESLSGYTVLRR